MRPEDEPQQERYAGAHDDEPAHVAPLAPAEQLLDFSAGDEHQQQEAEPVDEAEDVAVVPGGADDVLDERQPAEQCRPQDDTGQNFAHHFGLTHLHEQIAQQLGQADEQKQNQYDRGQLGIRHYTLLILVATLWPARPRPVTQRW